VSGEWQYDPERFNLALEEMRRHGAAAEAEAAQHVKDTLEADRCMGTIQLLEKRCGESWDGRYWGVWHDPGGWLLDCDGMLFYTPSKKVAQAQMIVSRSLGRFNKMTLDPDGFRVRCIQEWVDEEVSDE